MIRKLIRKWLGIEQHEEATVLVKYFTDEYNESPLTYNGDWIDVKACGGIQYFHEGGKSWTNLYAKKDAEHRWYVDVTKGQLIKIPLGFATKLPKHHEAILKVRSSTSKNTGLLIATSGVIDEGYCGPDDMWFAVMYATRDERIYLGERIAQFRIQRKQPKLTLLRTDELEDENRGGHGSTGRF